MRSGETLKMIESVKKHLDKKETVFLGGTKDPSRYLEMLEHLGTKATAEPVWKEHLIMCEGDVREMVGYKFKIDE